MDLNQTNEPRFTDEEMAEVDRLQSDPTSEYYYDDPDESFLDKVMRKLEPYGEDFKGFIEYLFTPSRHFGTGQYSEGGLETQTENAFGKAISKRPGFRSFSEAKGQVSSDELKKGVDFAASWLVPFYDSGVNISNVVEEYMKPEEERDYDYIKSQFTEAGQSAAIEGGLLLMGGIVTKYGGKGIKAVADKVKQYEIDPTAMSAFGAGAIRKKPAIDRAADVKEAERLIDDPDALKAWIEKEGGKGKRQENPADSEAAAQALIEGSITSKEARKRIGDAIPPPKEYTADEVRNMMPTVTDVTGAMGKKARDYGILGVKGFDLKLRKGQLIGTRLDIPAYNKYDKWVVSIHDGGTKEKINLKGSVLGYGQAIRLKNVRFGSDATIALDIARGIRTDQKTLQDAIDKKTGGPAKQNKATIARAVGEYVPQDPYELQEMAASIIESGSKEWTQVGMNPYRGSQFYDKKTGKIIFDADEMIQVGPLVLAKNAKVASISDLKEMAVRTKDGKLRMFSEGGTAMKDQMQMAFMNEGGVVDKDYGVADLSDERVVKKLEGWLNSSGSTKEIAEKALAGEVVNQQFLTRLTKPTTQELAQAAGIDQNSEEYKKLSDMYNTGTFNQRDIRDWNKIMKSDDPYKATQIATRQVIESGAYDKNPRDKGREEFSSSLYNSVTPAPKGQMGITSVNRPTGRGRDNYQDHLMTPSGRRLTQIVDAGNDEITRQNQLERFGYNLSPEEVSKESYLNPYMEKDIYYGIDWNPNTLDPATDNKDEKQTSSSPIILISPQGVRAIAYNQEQLNMYLGMGYRKAFNEGGMAMHEQMQMAFMNEGGIMDDGMDVDPVSGNEVPPGSLAEEVRDDIPAQLSEGEYVVPADVVRYYGVKFFEDLRDQAKMGLAEMEANGRIGGEPVPAGGPTDGPLTQEELDVVEQMMGVAEGGVIQNPYLQQQQMYSQPAPQAVGNTTGYAYGGQVQGYDEGSSVTSEPKPPSYARNVFNPMPYGLGFSFMGQPQQTITTPGTTTPGDKTPGDISVDNTTVMTPIEETPEVLKTLTLYGPDGETRIFTLPLSKEDKIEVDRLRKMGYSETKPEGIPSVSTGDDEVYPETEVESDSNAWMEKFDYDDMATLGSKTSGELKKSPVALVNATNAAQAAANIIIMEANTPKDDIAGQQAITDLKANWKNFVDSDIRLKALPDEFINGDKLAKDIVLNNPGKDIGLTRDAKDLFGKPIFKDENDFNEFMQETAPPGMTYDPSITSTTTNNAGETVTVQGGYTREGSAAPTSSPRPPARPGTTTVSSKPSKPKTQAQKDSEAKSAVGDWVKATNATKGKKGIERHKAIKAQSEASKKATKAIREASGYNKKNEGGLMNKKGNK